jgi:dihydroxy-acid dehydratase
MTTQDSSTYWKRGRVELRAAGFDPDRAAQTSAVVTIASAYTNAHRCNNRVRTIADLLVEILAERGGQGLIVGAPAVSDALTQGTPTAGIVSLPVTSSRTASRSATTPTTAMR